MPKSVFTDAYASIVKRLIDLRLERGVSQVELARRLGKTQQFVSRMERSERRIDMLEFTVIVRELGADPVAIYQEIAVGIPSDAAI